MPINIKEIRQLIKLMVDNELTELDIESGSTKVALKRGPGGEPIVAYPQPRAEADQAVQAAPAGPAGPSAAATSAAKPSEPPADKGLIEIKSPMVGTYYAAASSDGDALVHVGESIANDSVVCIIEAMKVMNEIRAECAGVIADICVSNAQPVEFGQVLFRVRPG